MKISFFEIFMSSFWLPQPRENQAISSIFIVFTIIDTYNQSDAAYLAYFHQKISNKPPDPLQIV